jgi:membrane protein required for colicin V production
MTAFDLIVVGIVGLSTVAAFLRGFVRVAASLAAWVLGFLAALRFSSGLGAMLPNFGESPTTRYVVAFVAILLAVLVVGALIGFVVSRMLRAIGLGFLDRFLGAVFGLARGLIIVVFFVLLAGLTALPTKDWWQNAMLSPIFTTAALSLRPWLPKAWAERLDYGGKERRPIKPVVKAGI